MSSGRDSASEQVQADVDRMLDLALPFAPEVLARHGELLPYGVALDGDGEARLVAGDPGDGDPPASTTVLDLLARGFRRDRDELIRLEAKAQVGDS
ncbi:MAG TPA: hypothetical protein VGO78_14245 [Acidimicrobiales bacterium]|nr:hypothetical protein [Acidimicrobiales bacterium]